MKIKKILKSIFAAKIRHNRVLFEGAGPYDNGYAMFEYALKNRPDLDVFFLDLNGIMTRESYPSYDPRLSKSRTIFQKFARFRFMSSFETAFCSYSVPSYSKTKTVFLGHGVSIKKAEDYCVSIQKTGADLVYVSKEWADIKKANFVLDKNKIVIAGQARSDKTFANPKNKAKLFDLIGKSDGTKTILCVLTFRRHKDGSFDPSIIFPDFININRLNDVLDAMKLKLVIKFHHVLDNADITCMEGFKNIVCLKNRDLLSQNLELASILPYFDAFISDYSGAGTDALLVNKPIAYFISDLNKYRQGKNEGFLVDDPLVFFPGDHIENASQFKSFLLDVSQGIDRFSSERQRISMVMNGFAKPPLTCCQTLLELYYPPLLTQQP